MSSLSTLLNPEAEETGTMSDAQTITKEEEQQPEPYPGMQVHSTDQKDVAHTLATLVTTHADPPAPWDTLDGAPRQLSNDGEGEEATTAAPRRQSVFEQTAGSVELPDPLRLARKLSNPALEHYRTSSKSPERYRRPSYQLAADHDLTLPSIQPDTVPTQHHSLGNDTSTLIEHGNEEARNNHVDMATEIQSVADHREPAYRREEATTAQIRQPSPSDPAPVPSVQSPLADQAHNTASMETPKPDIYMADAPPTTHTPLVSLKQEHSTHAHSPLRESSVPVPSTELPAPAPASTVPRKRPPPKSAGKKGTASSVKKEPASKKRKTDSATAAAKRSGTPSSQKPRGAFAGAKKLASTSATPSNSSPAPRSVRNLSTPPRSVGSLDPEADVEAQYSDDEEEEEDEGTPDPDADLYCLCRKPDTGTFMIGCDGGCDDWFHGKCVGIAERDKGLIDRYVCPRCSDKGLGPTTWKRMCRRIGCRLPARTPGATAGKKTKKETSTSKYCSDACGLQYFRDLVARTRGASDKSKARKSAPDYQSLGPRGGALSASELKVLVNTSNGVDEFKRLGEGILSPPTTPPSIAHSATGEHTQESCFTDAEQERMTVIATQKDAARTKHSILKDRLKFITMLKQAATTTAEERNLKPKEFCGFDPRMLWTDEEFAVWRRGSDAAEGLRTGIMPASMNHATTATDADGDTGMTNGEEGEANQTSTVCTKKRCTRHHDWAKLALDEMRFEMSENSEAMRGLDREEKDIVQRAGLRARVLKAGGAGGEVQFHDEQEESNAETSMDTEQRTAAAPEAVVSEIASRADTTEAAAVGPQEGAAEV